MSSLSTGKIRPGRPFLRREKNTENGGERSAAMGIAALPDIKKGV